MSTVTKAKTGKSSKNLKASVPMPPHQPTQPPIEISDLLDALPMDACVELTCRLLTVVPTCPSGAALLWAVLKTILLFVAEYGNMA